MAFADPLSDYQSVYGVNDMLCAVVFSNKGDLRYLIRKGVFPLRLPLGEDVSWFLTDDGVRIQGGSEDPQACSMEAVRFVGEFLRLFGGKSRTNLSHGQIKAFCDGFRSACRQERSRRRLFLSHRRCYRDDGDFAFEEEDF